MQCTDRAPTVGMNLSFAKRSAKIMGQLLINIHGCKNWLTICHVSAQVDQQHSTYFARIVSHFTAQDLSGVVILLGKNA